MDSQAKRCALILREFYEVLCAQSQALKNLNAATLQLRPPQGGPNLASLAPKLPLGPPTPNFLPPLPGATVPPLEANVPAFTTSRNSVPLAPSHPSLMPEDSFSGLLDMENTVLPTAEDQDISSADEAIDFDNLWQWPANTPFPTPGGSTNPSNEGNTAAY